MPLTDFLKHRYNWDRPDDTGRGLQREISYADMKAYAILPFIPQYSGDSNYIELKGLQLISASEHRDAYPVTALGRRGILGFTTGHSIWAGSLGFVALDGETTFLPILQKYANWRGIKTQVLFSSVTQLPPIDISIVAVATDGHGSHMRIRSAKFIDGGRSVGVQDIRITETYSYVAADVSVVAPLDGPESFFHE